MGITLEKNTYITRKMKVLACMVTLAGLSFADEQLELVNAYAELLEYSAKMDRRLSNTNDMLKSRLLTLMAQGIKHKYTETGYLPEPVADNMKRGLGGADAPTYCPPETGCQSPVNLEGIWGYGCWCNFGTELLTGSYQPVNKFDAICKDLQLCLRCAKMDGDNDGYECNPKTKVYNTTFSWWPSKESLEGECSKINDGDACGTHCCSCEVDMINELISTIWAMHVYEPEFKHPQFDREANCPTNPQGTLLDCCGYYPDRFPYSPVSRQCCENSQTLYNPLQKECCTGGEGVYQIGLCP